MMVPAANLDFPIHAEGRSEDLVSLHEHLRRGIWPTSAAIWAVATYMALFLIRPWETLLPWLTVIPFERACAIALIAVVVATRGLRLRLDLQTGSILTFVVALVVSAIFARNPELAFAGGGELYVYLTLLVFYWILVSVVRTPYELVFLVACWIVTMAISLAKCEWEFFVHGAWLPDMGVYRMVGINDMFGQPNSLAAMTVLTLPFWHFLYRVRGGFTQNWPPLCHKWFRRGLLIYPLLVVSAVILTNSRGGILALILFASITLLRGQTPRQKFYCATVIVVIASVSWAMMDEASRDRIRSILDPNASTVGARVSAEGRLAGFQAGIEMFRRFPLTGVGIGNFVEYRVQFVDGVELVAHNLAGEALGTTGLLGTSCFLIMVLATLVNCRRTIDLEKQRDNESIRVLAHLCRAIRVSIVIAFFCGLFGDFQLWFNWLWFAAFASLAARFASDLQSIDATQSQRS
jgi:O-antigen ligase